MTDEYTYAFATDSIRANLHDFWNLSGAPGKRAAIDAEFTRWLAQHDRDMAAKALREVAVAMPHMAGENMHSRWLRARADRIEKGAGDVR